MQTRLALGAAMAALLAAAPAAPTLAKSPVEPSAKRQQCFFPSSVSGFRAADEHNLYLRVGVRDVYQFEMFGPCQDINWNERIAIVTRGGGTICSGMDADIVTHTSIGPQRCPVRSVRKLTPEEVAALPKKSQP